MDIHQFTLPWALENIFDDEFWFEVRDAQFLTHLTLERFFGRLAIVDVSSNGCVPLPWLYVFPCRPTLEVDISLGIEHMQVNHGVQQLRATMTFAPCGRAYYFSFFIYYRK